MKLVRAVKCECGRVYSVDDVLREVNIPGKKRGRPRKHEENFEVIQK